jgi:hypothetical protein
MSTMRHAIIAAIRQELRRQADDDRAGTPYVYVDVDKPNLALIDGVVDLEKLAEAIEATLPKSTVPTSGTNLSRK